MKPRPSDPVLRDLRRQRRRGLTLIELIIAIGVMVVASGLFLEMLLSVSKLRRVNRERAEATEAAWTVLEAMRHERFEEIFARFNADPADDPDGHGTAPGHRFRVDGLEALENTPDRTVGTIVFPALAADDAPGLRSLRDRRRSRGRGRENARQGVQIADVFFPGPADETAYALREDYVDFKLGMPRDLNGDNVIDMLDHGADYVRLPVQVRLEWAGPNGPVELDLYTMFADNQPHTSTDAEEDEDLDQRFHDFWKDGKEPGTK